ncbi:hypothetical protein, partial [Bradyrhizobium sp. P5_C11_2]
LFHHAVAGEIVPVVLQLKHSRTFRMHGAAQKISRVTRKSAALIMISTQLEDENAASRTRASGAAGISRIYNFRTDTSGAHGDQETHESCRTHTGLQSACFRR